MTSTKKKWVHAGAVAAVGVLSDIGMQLSTGAFSPTRAVLVGVILGGVSRVAGAVLAVMATTHNEEPVDDHQAPTE